MSSWQRAGNLILWAISQLFVLERKRWIHAQRFDCSRALFGKGFPRREWFFWTLRKAKEREALKHLG